MDIKISFPKQYIFYYFAPIALGGFAYIYTKVT